MLPILNLFHLMDSTTHACCHAGFANADRLKRNIFRHDGPPAPCQSRPFRTLGRLGPVGCAFGICLALLTGCGSDADLARVRGTVTLNGRPLEGALVQFQPAARGGSPSSGITDADGRYELMFTFKLHGAMVGDHVVRIRTADSYYGDDSCTNRQEDRIPARYNSRSELKRTVEPGENTIDFAL